MGDDWESSRICVFSRNNNEVVFRVNNRVLEKYERLNKRHHITDSHGGETDFASEHPIKRGSKAPEIDAIRINQTQTNFRGSVVWSAPAVV